MRVVRSIVCSLCAAAVLAPAALARAQTDSVALSFTEAESAALARGTEIQIAERGIEAAELNLASTETLRLPRVTLESNLLVWNETLAFDIAIPGMEPPPGMELEPITVRDRVTSTTTLSVSVPLSSQLVLGDAIDIHQQNVGVAKEERRAAEVNAAYAAARAYVSVLLAQAARDISTTRVKQISAQLERVQVLVDEGVLEPVDALRLQTALAGARANVIEAESKTRLAIGLLVLAVGMSPESLIAVSDDFPANPGPPPSSIVESVITAEAQRTELGVLRMRTEQSKRGANLEKAKMFPNIMAVASFTHNEGMGTLQPENAWFVGLTLSWDLWDWGGHYKAHKAAKATAAQLELTELRVRDGIRIEVGATAQRALSSYELLEVTRAGVTAAEEAFRIQKDRYEEGAATTTDLLDADAELANARLAVASARYSYFAALIELANVTEQLPSAVLGALTDEP